jgi:hypothetical protein
LIRDEAPEIEKMKKASMKSSRFTVFAGETKIKEGAEAEAIAQLQGSDAFAGIDVLGFLPSFVGWRKRVAEWPFLAALATSLTRHQ